MNNSSLHLFTYQYPDFSADWSGEFLYLDSYIVPDFCLDANIYIYQDVDNSKLFVNYKVGIPGIMEDETLRRITAQYYGPTNSTHIYDNWHTPTSRIDTEELKHDAARRALESGDPRVKVVTPRWGPNLGIPMVKHVNSNGFISAGIMIDILRNFP